MDKINYKLVNFAIIVIIFFLIFKTFNTWISIFLYLKKIFFPIVLAFIIAYFLYPLIKIVRKKLKNNHLAVIIVLLLIFTFLFFILYLSIPLLINQVISFSYRIIPFIENIFSKLSIINLSFLEDIFINKINSFIYNLSSAPLKIVITSLSFIKNLLLIVILTIYFLFNMEKIKNKIINLFKKQEKIYNTLKEIDKSLTSYIKCLFVIFIIEMIEYTFIYFIIGHPNFLLLGLLAGVATMIPYFGGLFTNILALITAASYSNELFILCSIILIILPIIDSYVIDPKIYHKNTKINPLKCIISIIVCGAIFGIFGIVIAIPLIIIIEVIVKNYKR